MTNALLFIRSWYQLHRLKKTPGWDARKLWVARRAAPQAPLLPPALPLGPLRRKLHLPPIVTHLQASSNHRHRQPKARPLPLLNYRYYNLRVSVCLLLYFCLRVCLPVLVCLFLVSVRPIIHLPSIEQFSVIMIQLFFSQILAKDTIACPLWRDMVCLL